MNKPKMRLVDANTLKAEFTGNFREAYEPSLIKALIDVAPTIDAEPVVHAAWKPDFCLSIITCTHCKHSEDYGPKPNYCPNCGAKMDLEEE